MGKPSRLSETAAMKVIQSPEVLSDRGRDGKVESADGRFDLELGREKATPEHLFVAAYAACFHSALRAEAEDAHVDITGSTVTVEARLEEGANGGFQLTAGIRASVPGVSRSQAEHLLHLAHEHCPYSKMARNGIAVDLALD